MDKNGTADILQETHYYPFGLTIDRLSQNHSSSLTDYLYNSKELDSDFGLGWYHYGARWYDGALGRWMQVDPLAGKYVSWSPYNFGLLNPLRFIDPSGMEPNDIIYLLWSPQEGKEGTSAQSSGNITHHSAILIGDDENGWTFYSKSGGNDENGDAIFETKTFDTLEDFYVNFGQYSGYDAGLLVETSPEQDAQMKEMAESDLTTTYEGFTNNCADFCRNVVEAGKVPLRNLRSILLEIQQCQQEKFKHWKNQIQIHREWYLFRMVEVYWIGSHSALLIDLSHQEKIVMRCYSKQTNNYEQTDDNFNFLYCIAGCFMPQSKG
ncbi:MAG: RHS repeat-associated core domain-containing protein [Saprospiraceae bacterium]|nr:RHS repeat-associated core domain-containing protein [Saprospiraceae bacterium]